MLNITPAKAQATGLATTLAQTAGDCAAQAVTRPLADLGAGAFFCEGTWASSRMNEAASITKGAAISISTGKAHAGAAAVAYQTSIVQVDSVQRDTHNSIQTARLHPVTKGGVGPHPAREPVPV